MTPYSARFASAEVLHLFSRIQRIVAHLPDVDLGTVGTEPILLSCHMLARAVGKVFNLRWTDGKFAKVYAHSWLHTLDGEWIIDCYPVGIISGALLVDATNVLTPGRVLYRRTLRFGKELPFNSPAFRKSVRRLTQIVEETKASLSS